MQFLRITGPHPYLATIQVWYEQAFPMEERRDFTQLLQMLDSPDMHICALVEQEKPIGFIIYWQWDNLIYVEHFAVDPEQRGRQLGQKALQSLMTLEKATYVLEVELPTDDMSQRRVRFYERQGFFLNPFAYKQPPYRSNGTAIPMKLMSIPAIEDWNAFQQVSQQIDEKVYRRFY